MFTCWIISTKRLNCSSTVAFFCPHREQQYLGIIEFVWSHFPLVNLLGLVLSRWLFCHRAGLLPAVMDRIRRILSSFTSSHRYCLNILHSRGHSGSQLSQLSFKHLVETQLVLDGSGESVHLCMDGLHGFVIGGQLLLKGLVDLRLAVDKIRQGKLVRIERIRIPITSLIVWAWLIPPLTSLWTKLIIVAIEE